MVPRNDMNLANTKQLEDAISEMLKNSDSKKKGSSWYLDGTDCTCVLNLQKSSWGGQYYINLGVSVKALQASPFPKESQCDIRIRLTELVENKSLLERSLDLENETVDPASRIKTLENGIKTVALPFLTKTQTFRGIRELVAQRKLKTFAMNLKIKKVLGLREE
jgi:hypothetical protein